MGFLPPWSLALMLTFACLVAISCNPREFSVFKKTAQALDEAGTRAAEEAIRKDPKLRMVNEVCSAIPLPADAQFIRKGDLDDQKITISVYYSSATSLPQLDAMWERHFVSNGWILRDRDATEWRTVLDYENETYKVNIQHGGMSDQTVFAFGCSLKSR